MRVLNMTHKHLCVGDSMDSIPPDNWIIKPGGEMIVNGIFDGMKMAVVDTKDGIRITIIKELIKS